MKNIDIVYHCAATTHEGLSVFSPFEITKIIILLQYPNFTAAINEKVKRIIFVRLWQIRRSGATVYWRYENKAIRPLWYFKSCFRRSFKNLCELNGIEWVIAVPHNIIGPNRFTMIHSEMLFQYLLIECCKANPQ